ncbi:MAG: RyR domain-containing protein [Chloroflexota bacterium]
MSETRPAPDGEEGDGLPGGADTTLPAELMALVETLAGRVHTVWAQRRLAEGWSLGERRDDERREHPGLVPYDQLPEEEKEYDRHTVVVTLKALRDLGYRIERVP